MNLDKKAQLYSLIADMRDLPKQASSEDAVSSMRPESALARKLVARALHTFLGRAPSSEELAGEVRTAGGKPCFPAFPDFHYNISHSGSFVVCAVCDRPVGIDLQKIPEQAERAMKIAKRFFSGQEQETLNVLRGNDEPEALCRLFCRYWTARESYIKLTGRGLSEPFGNFRPDLEKGEILVLKHHCIDPSAIPGSEGTGIPEETDNQADSFYLAEYQAPDGYCLTVCSTAPLPDEPAYTGNLD